MKQDETLKAIPVLMYTSSSSERDVNSAYQSGANAYLQKPMTTEDLDDIIRTVEHFWLDLAFLPTGAG
jgi:DNA-binding NarL/FixJ family response regulator